MESWVADEVKHLRLKDKRLEKRLVKMLDALQKKPATSLPETFRSNAATKAAYRFFGNEKIAHEDILSGCRTATLERIAQEKEVLFLSDTTTFDFGTHKKTTGLGYINAKKEQGILMHSTLPVTTSGIPLGLFQQKLWARTNLDAYGKGEQRCRDVPIEEKESYCWIEALREVERHTPSDTHAIFICDRGADIFEILNAKNASHVDVLIRSCHNRRIEESDKNLFDFLSDMKPQGQTIVSVGHARGNMQRNAQLDIRYSPISISSPCYRSKNRPAVKMFVVEAREVNASKEVENPILWRLLTTMPIDSFNTACRCIHLYSKRWIIERYHFVCKSGCRIEDLQLESACRLKVAISVYGVVAWRLMYMMYQSRETPNEPCETILAKDQWQAAYCFINKVKKAPPKPPTTREAILLIAKLGGFLGRKSDGDPGIVVLWRGLRRLDDITETYLLFKG